MSALAFKGKDGARLRIPTVGC
jgi:hypothetical protein